MAIAVSSSAVRMTGRNKELVLTLTPSGNYTTGGDTVNLGSVSAPIGVSNGTVGYPGNIETYEVINTPAGYTAQLIKGSSLANWLLKVFEGGAAVSSPSAEIPAAAYPAGVTAGTFQIRLVGKKFQL